jgi:hypothetical protein
MNRKILACLPIFFIGHTLAWGQVSLDSMRAKSNHAPISMGPAVSSNSEKSVNASPQQELPASNPAPMEQVLSAPEANSDARLFASVEYLLWWTKHSPLAPSLITTGDVTGTPPASLGNGGVALTRNSLDEGALSGVRVGLGFWLGGGLGIEAGGFVLPSQSRTISYSSDAGGNPVLAFRHQDPPMGAPPAEDAFQASLPAILSSGPPQIGPYAGSLGLTTRTRLWSMEGNLVGNVWQSEEVRWQLLAGFRYLDLSESLDISFQRQAIPGSGAMVFFQGSPFPDPDAVSSSDSFRTRNQYYAGQIGARGEIDFGRFFLVFAGKLALGDVHESVNIQGTSTLVQPGLPNITVPGGQFAAASNIGRATHDQFNAMPELEISIGYQFSPNFQVFVGYNLLYLNKVVRPGNQVDLVVDTAGTQIDPGFTGAMTSFPRPFFSNTNFWAQGLDFGLEVSY